MENCLRAVATKVYGQGKGLRGTTRANFLEKKRSIKVYYHELDHGNGVIKNRAAKCEEEKEHLEAEIQELEKICEELLEELQSAEVRMQDLENESAKAGEENKQLSEYLDFLEDVMICTNCSGNLKCYYDQNSMSRFTLLWVPYGLLDLAVPANVSEIKLRPRKVKILGLKKCYFRVRHYGFAFR